MAPSWAPKGGKAGGTPPLLLLLAGAVIGLFMGYVLMATAHAVRPPPPGRSLGRSLGRSRSTGGGRAGPPCRLVLGA